MSDIVVFFWGGEQVSEGKCPRYEETARRKRPLKPHSVNKGPVKQHRAVASRPGLAEPRPPVLLVSRPSGVKCHAN